MTPSKEIDCLDPTHELVVFLNNDMDDWANLHHGATIAVFTPEQLDDLLVGESETGLAEYHLDDPEDLRRLANLLEKRAERKLR